ncbi:MAG TPA: PAS domain S-box protein [Candidatus Ozemobacteraceae bacterium]
MTSRNETETAPSRLVTVHDEIETARAELEEAREYAALVTAATGLEPGRSFLLEPLEPGEETNLFQEMLDHTDILLYRFDLRSGCYSYCNRRGLEYLPVLRCADKKKELDIMEENIYPGDAARVLSAILGGVQRTGSAPYRDEIEYRRRGSDGKYRWVYEMLTFLPGENGTAAALIGAALDMTEERAAQAQLRDDERKHRLLTEVCADVIWIVGNDEQLIYVNGAVESMFGYTPEEFRHLSIVDLAVPASLAENEYSLSKYIEMEAASPGTIGTKKVESEFRRRDGTRFWGELIFSAYRDDQGHLLGLCGSLRDITERRKVEQELKQAHRELEQRVRERTAELEAINAQLHAEVARRRRIERFMLHFPEKERAAIGKELNDGLCQELVGIRFLCDAVRENLLGQDDMVIEEVSGIRDLLNDAVKQAKAMARGLDPILIDPQGLASSLETLAETTSTLFNISCRFAGGPGGEVEDPDLALNFYRIAQEAIHNAIRHGDARNIELSLTGTGGEICLTVTDDGCGIAARPANPGGLGTKIMEYRMRAMSGTLQFRERDGGGTIVACAAPVRKGRRLRAGYRREKPA